ncbi:hypothetical protein BU16DRAFT_455313 [Lophium mytilinum]|uniref:Acyltransferase MbtK/IucB-like conserved domain-containing protein n=1 Tax=Lophium mytilinum TaxID=390894 RepID=A0A6A6R142_9PEZI|nr:hypothetical protein BU16DRAFT_455313 [Lophium mytilinum]
MTAPEILDKTVLAKLCLPHPYLTTYHIAATEKHDGGTQLLQVRKGSPKNGLSKEETDPPLQLHNSDLYFTPLQPTPGTDAIPSSNNSAWARARRSLSTNLTWSSSVAPTPAQFWLLSYAIFVLRPELESVRVALNGPSSSALSSAIISTSLGIAHPEQDPLRNEPLEPTTNELLLLRATFWQGAGAPFGAGSAWLPSADGSRQRFSANEAALTYTLTTLFPSTRVHTLHPRRPAKPTPGSVIYSRYIPHLDENFSMVALDYRDAEHVNLFHTWQNDPRVAAGWNEEGTVEQHTEYLRKMDADKHQVAVLARFEENYFAYFEIYWVKEDHLGAHYTPHDFDRGRHSLVGNANFRGRHRATAWWASLIHYLFLDDPRTMAVVGEPKLENASVLAYDLMTGFSIEKFVDLPHKRSAFMRCGRERFFQLCPLDSQGGWVGGTGIRLPAKL